MIEARETERIVPLMHAALERLAQRAGLRQIAQRAIRGYRHAERAPNTYVGELDDTYHCHLDPAHPGDSHHFMCSLGGFHCAEFEGSFACPSSQDTYSICTGSGEYACHESFGCSADVFDCFDFECDDGYSCDVTYDFFCGSAHACMGASDFACSSGHVFHCYTGHDCWDSFQCSATGSPPCAGNYSVGGGDTTAGDFLCGDTIGDTDTFDCTADFTCSSFDDFRCDQTAVFDCGSANGTGTFDCGADFECYGSEFQCCADFSCTGEHQCVGSYTCNPKFTCGSGFRCPHGNFTCSAEFECTDGGGGVPPSSPYAVTPGPGCNGGAYIM